MKSIYLIIYDLIVIFMPQQNSSIFIWISDCMKVVDSFKFQESQENFLDSKLLLPRDIRLRPLFDDFDDSHLPFFCISNSVAFFRSIFRQFSSRQNSVKPSKIISQAFLEVLNEKHKNSLNDDTTLDWDKLYELFPLCLRPLFELSFDNCQFHPDPDWPEFALQKIGRSDLSCNFLDLI